MRLSGIRWSRLPAHDLVSSQKRERNLVLWTLPPEAGLVLPWPVDVVQVVNAGKFRLARKTRDVRDAAKRALDENRPELSSLVWPFRNSC